MAPSDAERLVKDCLKHRPEAQKELYDTFAPAMLGVCFRYTKNIQDAENILQEGFVKVFKNLSGYRGEGELGVWIRKIMVNTTLTYLKTHRQYLQDMVYEDSFLHPVADDDPDIRLAAKELAGMIRQLPTGFQAIFNLHAVEGYSHVEIAGMLGINPSTSRSQYSRARKLLIQWLQETSLREKGGSYGK